MDAVPSHITLKLFFIFILIFLSAALYINFCYVRKIISCLLNMISNIYKIIFSESFTDSWFLYSYFEFEIFIGLF